MALSVEISMAGRSKASDLNGWENEEAGTEIGVQEYSCFLRRKGKDVLEVPLDTQLPMFGR